MGKFTDDFFMFPIKVYDGFSLKKALEAEDKETTEGPLAIDWVMGYARIPAKDLSRMMWHDGFSRERSVEDVANNGFDLTIVVSDMHGEFVSTWPRKRFEEKINEFMEKWEDNQTQNKVMWLDLGNKFANNSPSSPTSPKGDEKKSE